MKTILKTIVVCVFLAGLSCEKKEETTTNIDQCVKGKFIFPWCSSIPVGFAVIQVLNSPIGTEYNTPNKAIQNAVRAHLSLNLRNSGTDLSQISPSDSIFYFTYEKKTPDFGVCEVCCSPKVDIRIVSILSKPCEVNN